MIRYLLGGLAETAEGIRWMFQDVHPGGVAAQAGIQSGDVLLKVARVRSFECLWWRLLRVGWCRGCPYRVARRFLPRRAWRGEDLIDPHPGRRWSDPREGAITRMR
jgi:PDZ domain-containing protein